MVDIYVLECEDGKIYVGKTNHGVKRLKQHISGRGAEWTKLHKPKRVVEYHTNAKGSDEKKVTEQMIRKYGSRKVRGGPWVKRKMTKSELNKLNKEVGFKPKKSPKASPKKKATPKRATTYRCSRCGREGHNKTQCYAQSSVKGGSIRSYSAKKTRATKKPAAKKCSRCGRTGHDIRSCYAKKHSSGSRPKKPQRKGSKKY